MTHRSRTSRMTRLLAASVVASLLVAACGGGSDDDGGDDGDVEESADTTVDGGGGDTDSGDDGDDGADDDSGTVETIAPENEEADPVPGGIFTVAIEADIDGLNPTNDQVTAAPGLMMAAAVFDTLTTMTEDGEPVPYLAESLTPNDDFTSWDVKVREGVTFHDGTPLNADAVLRNFQAQLDSALVGLAVRPFYPEEGAIEKVDEFTVRYNLLNPNVRFPSYLATQLGMVASPAWLDAAADDPLLNQQPVGTGPFVFESREEDSITSFVRNDDWWNGTPYLDGVSFRIVTDPATRADLLESGEIQAFHASDPQTTLRMQEQEGAGVRLILNDTGAERFVMINTAQAPFDDIRVRQALAFATPKQNVLALIGGGLWQSADSRFHPSTPYHNPDIVQAADTPDEAAALVEAYCSENAGTMNEVLGVEVCTDGKINIEYQDSGPSVVQDNLQDVLEQGWSPYFNVTHDRQFQDDHILQTVTGQYNVNTWRQFDADDPVTDNVWLICDTIGGLSLNFPQSCDPARDELLLEAAATEDGAARAELFQQAEQLINEQFVYVFLAHELWMWAMAPEVRGVCDRTAPSGEQQVCFSQGRVWFDSIWLQQ